MQNVEEPKINECVLERERERERVCAGGGWGGDMKFL